MQSDALRNLAISLVILTTALAGCAGDDAAPVDAGPTDVTTIDESPTAQTGSIQGLVVSDEEIPIPRVEVGVVDLDATATTGANGTFEFRGVPLGKHTIAANRLGYASVAQSVDVLPGEVVETTIVLEALEVSDPYFLSLPHAALHEVGEKWATWALSLAEVDQCTGCTWTDAPPEGSTHLVVEVFGAHSFAKPTGADREWYWLFSEGNGNGSLIVQGEFDLPIRLELDADDYEGTTNFWSQLLCEEQWVCFQERRDVWLTFFYEHDEIPDGFTAAPPE